MLKDSYEISTDFESVYCAYFSKMKHFAKVYVLSEEEAENMVQDVFFELWEKREVLSMPVNLIAYLFTSLKNKCLNYLRHQLITRETADHIREEHRLAMQMSFNSLEVFEQDLLSGQNIETLLTRALDSLPERCREIFILSKFEGKKQKEIATMLNISTNTVETQMSIAYRKLRIELKDYLPLLLFIVNL
jgi:RNA polymerase sigma-70 factor (ECF subfamily)